MAFRFSNRLLMVETVPLSVSICYWCGCPASSREHVPPLSFFPKGKRTNLITVPSCYSHNEALSAHDEAFRFYVQACSGSSDALEIFDTKTLRGLERPEAAKLVEKLFGGSRPIIIEGQVTRALQVNPSEQNLFFEKVVRGLYFYLFGKPAPAEVTTVSPNFVTAGLDYVALGKKLLPYLFHPDAVEPPVAQPNIFRFRYYRYIDQGREAFIVRCIFYGSVTMLGMCTRH
jgi:hypothetical protein